MMYSGISFPSKIFSGTTCYDVVVPILAAFTIFVVSGCERPFVEISDPVSVVVDPDLTVAQIDPEILLSVQSTSFRSVVRVRVNGVDMSRAAGDEVWQLPVTLTPGINLLRIEAMDEENRLGVDSTYAIHIDYVLEESAVSLPVGLGGQSAVLLTDGTILVTGGSVSLSADATNETLLFRPDTDTFESAPPPLNTPRVGHTSTNIGNDRVLIIGGAQRAEISAVDELVESVELYSHDTGTMLEIPVSGAPIRRMYHTTSFRHSSQGPILDLTGGTGDVQYFPEPLLSVRGDIRSFLFRNDSLIALSPSVGPFVEQLSGHVQVAVTNGSPGDPAAFILAGVGGIPPGGPIGLVIDFTTDFGILVNPLVRSFSTRSSHAAVTLDEEFIGFFGGISWPDGIVVDTAELYVYSTGQTFLLANQPGNEFTRRFSHTATVVPSGKVILLGGFDPTGTGMTLIRSFSYSASK